MSEPRPPRSSDAATIEAVDLHKRYGETHAVAGVSLAVPAGSILAVLGPNGAGKTTSVRMLTTLTRPDSGSARVAGIDVVADPATARRLIGVTGQDATLDEVLTGRQNLVMIGRLARLPKRTAVTRADELLDQFDLIDAADRQVKGYSGGMRRRLDLAASIVTRPPVLFLDEPTTGLDPSSRLRMWDVIRALVADGTTLLLTTQYLDEADQLADAISVIDHGRVIAHGTAAELKARVGGEQVALTIAEAGDVDRCRSALAPLVSGPVTVGDRSGADAGAGRVQLRASVRPGAGLATALIRELDRAGVEVDDLQIHHPSLDDVFFALTGAPAIDPDASGPSDDAAAPLEEVLA